MLYHQVTARNTVGSHILEQSTAVLRASPDLNSNQSILFSRHPHKNTKICTEHNLLAVF